MNVIISPSMLSADFANLERDLKAVAASGAQWLHVDVMDGHFVPNITIGPDQVACIRKCIDLPFDVHLMISEPLKYIPKFAKAGADIITVHVESEDDTAECLALIKECGKKAGIVLSPDTPTSAIAPYLDAVSMVLVLCVYQGFGGQSYIPESTKRLRDIRAMIGSRDIRLEVDGGVNFDTLEAVVEAGADTVVSGSCLFNGDMTENVAKFNEIIATVVVE